MAASSPSLLRLAILTSAKKRSTLARHFTESSYLVRGSLVSVSTLDSPDALIAAHDQHPFDMLLVKVTDLMTTALYAQATDPAGAAVANASLERLSTWLHSEAASGLTVLDPLERVEAVLNRAQVQTAVQAMHLHCETPMRMRCTMPSALLYQHSASKSVAAIGGLAVLSVLPDDLAYPVICKSVAACGTTDSHRMYVLRSERDFPLMHAHATAAVTSSSPTPTSEPSPAPVWLVQRYVNHGGVLYKAYVMGDEVYIFAKASLPDLAPDSSQAYHLNSQDMLLHELRATPSNAATSLAATTTAVSSSPQLIIPPEVHSLAHACAAELRRALGLTLFGFDLIRATQATDSSFVDAATPAFHVVDINFFPSYTGVFSEEGGFARQLIATCLQTRGQHAPSPH